MDYLKLTKKEEGYVIVQMNRPKVNAINAQMVNEIRATFKNIENDDTVKGVILTGFQGVFSAGLDLVELYEYDKDQMKDFFIAFGNMYIELVEFTKPFICAIHGHSPAGGTVIAITSDYRVMAEGEKYGIGLNEVAVNVQISNNLIAGYNFWLGKQLAYKNIIAGNLLNPQKALAGGLVDEVVTMDQVLPRAERRMQHFLKADQNIWLNTKAKLRKSWHEALDKNSVEELEQAMKVWWSPEVRNKMQMFIFMLKNKSKVS